MCQQQGKEKLIKKCSGCDKEDKITNDTITTSTSSNKTADNAKSEEDEKIRETTMNENRESEIQHDITTQPLAETADPENITSPPENTDSSNTVEITTDKHPDSVEKSSAQEVSEMPKAPKEDTTSTDKG